MTTNQQLPLHKEQDLSSIQLKTLKAYPTFQGFMTDYKPEQLLVVYEDVRTIIKSVSCVRLSLSDVATLYDNNTRKAGLKYISDWLDFVNRFSNINKPLTEISTVAYMIYIRFNHFYFSDLKIIFEKLMCGEFGSFYGSVDAQRILTSFTQYDQERKQTIYRLKQNQENFIKQQMDALYNEADSRAFEEYSGKNLDYREIAQIRDKYRQEVDAVSKEKMENYRQLFIDKLKERMK